MQLDAALRYVAEYPEGAPLLSGSVRHKVIRDYPYSVLYEIVGDLVFVARIASHYRGPDPS